MIPHFVPDLVEQDDLQTNKELKEHKDIWAGILMISEI